MGPTQSKNIIDIINQVSAEVVIKNMQHCAGSVMQSQTMVLAGTNNNLSQRQDASLNLSCAANFQVDNKVINDITNEIIQKAQAQGYALLSVGGTSSDNITKIKNEISTKITTEMVQHVVSGIVQQQNMIALAGSVNTNISQVQSASVVQKAIMDAVASTNLATNIAGNFDQRGKSESKNPLDFITNLFSNFYFLILLIIVIVIGALLYLLK